MKTIKWFTLVLLMVVLAKSSLAKMQRIGLYLTLEDYLNHKLSYECDGSRQTQVHLHDLFGAGKVVAWQKGRKRVFNKSQIFGYRLNNHDYRYIDNNAYLILDTTGFYIYSYNKLVPQGKGLKLTPQYYFSPKPDSAVRPLTMDNLQAAFTNDTRFLYTVTDYFKSDSELAAYDSTLKAYKLKYLYARTLK